MREKSDHRNYIKSLDTLLPVLAVVSTLPTYLRTLCLVGGAMIPKVLAALSAIKDIEVAAESCVAERQSLLDSGSHTESKDILSSLMDISSNKNDKIDFGLTEVKVEVYVALYVNRDVSIYLGVVPNKASDLLDPTRLLRQSRPYSITLSKLLQHTAS